MTPLTIAQRRQLAREERLTSANVTRIIAIVARAGGYSPAELLAPGREEPRQSQRQIAIHLASKLTGLSSAKLVPFFRRGDSGTVRYAINVVRVRVEGDERMRTRVAALEFACREAVK